VSEIFTIVYSCYFFSNFHTSTAICNKFSSGLERRLRERIPEIQEVIQAMPAGPDLNEDEVEVILNGVRPFLQVAGGSIDCESITGESSVQPCITLKMQGSSASLNSVKLEIVQRLQRHFMIAGLQVEWA